MICSNIRLRPLCNRPSIYPSVSLSRLAANHLKSFCGGRTSALIARKDALQGEGCAAGHAPSSPDKQPALSHQLTASAQPSPLPTLPTGTRPAHAAILTLSRLEVPVAESADAETPR